MKAMSVICATSVVLSMGPVVALAAPPSTGQQAIEVALNLAGLRLTPEVQAVVTQPKVTDHNTPFLSDKTNQTEAWSVELSGSKPILQLEDSRVKNTYIKKLTLLIDSASGDLLSVVSEWPADIPPIAPEPTAESAERQIRAIGQRYEGFPDQPPRATLLDALEAAASRGYPVQDAKQIIARYVLYTRPNYKRRPVWVIQLRGISPVPEIKPPPSGEELAPERPIPIDCLNHMTVRVDALTGKCLGATNTPQPDNISP